MQIDAFQVGICNLRAVWQGRGVAGVCACGLLVSQSTDAADGYLPGKPSWHLDELAKIKK